MDHKAFWWMVNRRKRSRTGSVVSPIQTESGIKHELSEIVDVWADHFRSLATPSVGEEYDNDFKARIENGFQNLYAQSFRNQNNFLDTPLQAKEVSAVLKKMHLGKAGGLDGCVPEHFRYGGPVLEDLLLLVSFSDRVAIYRILPNTRASPNRRAPPNFWITYLKSVAQRST